MLYAVIAQDVADSLEKRMSARPAHVERLDPYITAGVYDSVVVKPFNKVLP